MKIKVSAFLLAALVGMPAVAQEKPNPEPAKQERKLPSVKEVTAKLDDLYRADTSEGTVTMTIVNDRGTRKLTIEQWSRGKDDALFVIRKPRREAGTATLKTKEGLWNYAPRADRMIRVPSGLLSDAWMGSHFTNDDLVRESKYEDDYETKLSWKTEGAKTYLLATMTPRPKAPVVYTKVEYYLDADTWIPARADYFDRGKLMRRMTFTDVQKIGDRLMPKVMTLVPMDKPDEKTEMRYEEIKFNHKIKSDLFTKKGLRRAAKK